jgi:hypothetical protein
MSAAQGPMAHQRRERRPACARRPDCAPPPGGREAAPAAERDAPPREPSGAAIVGARRLRFRAGLRWHAAGRAARRKPAGREPRHTRRPRRSGGGGPRARGCRATLAAGATRGCGLSAISPAKAVRAGGGPHAPTAPRNPHRRQDPRAFRGDDASLLASRGLRRMAEPWAGIAIRSFGRRRAPRRAPDPLGAADGASSAWRVARPRPRQIMARRRAPASHGIGGDWRGSRPTAGPRWAPPRSRPRSACWPARASSRRPP